MQLYRDENIQSLLSALNADQFDDDLQDTQVGKPDFLDAVARFLEMYLTGPNVLEIGCGSGASLGHFGITHGLEPCEARAKAAAKRWTDVDVGVAEAMPYPDSRFDSVLMIGGWYQLRSDYESLIEANRVLRPRGRLIFNLHVRDEVPVVYGRVLGPRNYVADCRRFGFELVGWHKYNSGPRFVPAEQEAVILCLEKASVFDARRLNLPQVQSVDAIKNYVPERDFYLL
jgi:SAM-dependent methyltransferase